MHKMCRFLMISVLAFILFTAGTAFASDERSVIDTSLLQQGIIKINYTKQEDKQAIVKITKDQVNLDYILVEGASYPLQLGNGSYTVLVAEEAGGGKYKVVAQGQVDLALDNPNEVYLQSISLIHWDSDTKAVVKAQELTQQAVTDADKTAAIYSFLTENFTYDDEKAAAVKPGFIPNLDEAYDASKGICYDYAATFAAMARSVGLPTKLVMGYRADTPDVYHAWNEVYLQETDEWVIIDTTYDAALVQSGQAAALFKAAADYITVKSY
ncbi:transglutaminase-like domain-containing protein [Paenibacillus sp. y28]|uniref:transglutaminase-like domain-containing protein n=1 Tax=Paenibacillus sp. y28 TaxID=3129110 RepID=UPI003016D6E5